MYTLPDNKNDIIFSSGETDGYLPLLLISEQSWLTNFQISPHEIAYHVNVVYRSSHNTVLVVEETENWSKIIQKRFGPGMPLVSISEQDNTIQIH